MTKHSRPFALCLDNRGTEVSLILGKIYRILPDARAARDGLVRVIDESGEDYGYSAERFFVLDVPQALAKILSTRQRLPVV